MILISEIHLEFFIIIYFLIKIKKKNLKKNWVEYASRVRET